MRHYAAPESLARVNEPGEKCRIDDKAAPLGVIRTSGSSRDDLVEGFTLLLEAAYILADSHQHVAKLDKLCTPADRSMTGDDDGLVRHAFERGIRQANHAIDTAAAAVVDKGIVAIPPDVPERHHIGFGEVNRNVAVRMAGTIAPEDDGLAIELECFVCFEDDRRTSTCRCRLKGIVPIFYTVRS